MKCKTETVIEYVSWKVCKILFKSKFQKLKKNIFFMCVIILSTMLLPFALRAEEVIRNSPQTKIRNLDIGDSVHANNLSVKLNGIAWFTGPTNAESPECYLAVDFTVNNLQSEMIWVFEESEFYLQDSRGFKYLSEPVLSRRGDLSSKIISGGHNRGDIYFKVPLKVTGLTIVFDFTDFGAECVSEWILGDPPSEKDMKKNWNAEVRPKSMYKEIFLVKKKLNALAEMTVIRETEYLIYNQHDILIEKGTYENGKLKGLWESFNSAGNVVIRATVKPSGEIVEWIRFSYFDSAYTNAPRIKQQSSWKSNMPHGQWIIFFESGTIMADYTITDGRINGTAKVFYPSGTIRAECFYKDGILQNRCVVFYDNGKKHIEMKFKNGVLAGAPKLFDVSGTVKSTEGFDPGTDPVFSEITNILSSGTSSGIQAGKL